MLKVTAMADGSILNYARTLASIGLISAFGLVGCGGPGPESSGAPAPTDDTPSATVGAGGGQGVDEPQSGSIKLELDVAGSHLASASYTIVGPSYQTTGSFDISNSTRISGIVGGIPFGTGYSVTLTAATSDKPALNCNGSAAFEVSSTTPTTVSVPVSCHGEKDETPPPPVPAPVPPFAVAGLFLLLLGLGIGWQWRSGRPQLRNG